MGLAICQHCGAILQGRLKNCQSCRASVSTFSATPLAGLAHTTKPLSVEVGPDQAVLERLLVARPSYLASQPAAAGHGGNGHGNGESSPASTATLAPQSTSIFALHSQDVDAPDSPGTPNHRWWVDLDPAPGEEAIGAEATPSVSAIVNLNTPNASEPVIARIADVETNPGGDHGVNTQSAYVYKLAEEEEQLPRSGANDAPASTEYIFSNSTRQNSPASQSSGPFGFAMHNQAEEIKPLPDSGQATKATAQPGAMDFFASAPPLIAPPESHLEKTQPAQASFPTELFPAMGQPLPQPAAAALPVEQETQAIKVAAPLGYQKKEAGEAPAEAAPQLSEVSQAKDEVEEDDEAKNGFDYEAPVRRSFSGKPGNKAIKKEKPKEKPRPSDEDQEDEETPKKSTAPGEIELFGVTLTQKKALLIASLACLVIFIALQSLMSVGGTLMATLNDKLGKPALRVSGIWRFAMQANKDMRKGVMYIHQREGRIYGTGRDNAMGTFRFSGALKGGGQIEFLKQYVRGPQDVGKPITFRGDIDTSSTPLFAKGDFQSTYRRGYSWRAEIVNVTGIWEAELVKPMAEDIGGAIAGGQTEIKPADDSKGGFLTWATKNGLVLAGVLVSIVVFLWGGAVWLFGPDGWRAQRDKAKYIPSQVKKDHNRELNHLAQPLKAGSLPLGRRLEWKLWTFWEKKDLALPPDVRTANPHFCFLGGGGKGKSRLMSQMIAHDIESGDRAVVVIDSDGSTSDLIINWIASHQRGKEFAKRTMIIDPTHPGGSLAYNPLEMPEDSELSNAASAIEYGFKAIYTEPPGSQSQWTPQTAQILRSAALLLMITGRTLADLSNLLQDNDYRDVLLEEAERKSKDKPAYRNLLDSWGNYKKMARTEQWINWVEPILNRVQRTVSDQRVRPVITPQVGDINLQNIITEKQVLIVHIPKGELHENANLVGSLIVTGLKQAALAVSLKAKGASRPVALYVDEFDHFIEKETFNALTSETKVFQIGFMGATKTLQDFPEDFRNNLVAKFGTMAIFALPKKDGDMLGPQMFRVDGRKRKHETLNNFFNPINTSPQFEFVSDEEKLNIDKILGQPERVYFCYRVGSVAGLFHLKSHPFNDIPEKDINLKLIEKMRKGASANGKSQESTNASKTSQDSVKV